MPWQQRTIGLAAPGAIQAISEGAGTVSNALSLVTKVAATLVDVASFIYASAVDPAASLVSALAGQVQTFVDDTFSTGAYVLTVTPYNVGPLPATPLGIPRLTPGAAIDRMVASFDDEGDPSRPVFSETAQTAGLAFLATAPDLSAFDSVISGLAALLDISDIKELAEKVKEQAESEGSAASRTASRTSRPPDWRSISLKTIPPFDRVYTTITALLENLRSAAVTADNALSDLVDILKKRVDRLAALVDQLQSAVDAVVAATAATGLYVLDIPLDAGGSARLKDALRDPDIESLSGNGLTVAVLMVAGGPSIAGIEAIKALFT